MSVMPCVIRDAKRTHTKIYGQDALVFALLAEGRRCARRSLADPLSEPTRYTCILELDPPPFSTVTHPWRDGKAHLN